MAHPDTPRSGEIEPRSHESQPVDSSDAGGQVLTALLFVPVLAWEIGRSLVVRAVPALVDRAMSAARSLTSALVASLQACGRPIAHLGSTVVGAIVRVAVALGHPAVLV